MAVHDTYSKRLKRELGEIPDVYQYDDIPKPLRIQICQIMDDAIGEDSLFSLSDVREVYNYIAKTLRRESGQFVLSPMTQVQKCRICSGDTVDDTRTEVQHHIVMGESVNIILDAVEVVWNEIEKIANPRPILNDLAVALGISDRKYAERTSDRNKEIASEAIAELNTRFQEHGVGYRFENGKIIRLDSEHIHLNVTKPALKILQAEEYKIANDEYMGAFDHYRNTDYSGCLNESLKAFESVMKIICAKRGWEHAKSATASNLVKTCMKNNLLPTMMESKMNNLIALLESSVPTMRNQKSGHGGGKEKQEIPQHLARYVLDMTGSAIVFLANSDAELS